MSVKHSWVNEWCLGKGLADSSVLVWPLCADKMCVSSICDKYILAVCHKAWWCRSLGSYSCSICGGFSQGFSARTKEPNKHMHRLPKQWQWVASFTFLPCSENERLRKWYNSWIVCHTGLSIMHLGHFTWVCALLSPLARGHLQARAPGHPSNRTDNTVVNECIINITKGASFRTNWFRGLFASAAGSWLLICLR